MNTKRLLKGKGIGFVVIIVLIIIIAIIYWPKPPPPPPCAPELRIGKFNDLNGNGVHDEGEPLIVWNYTLTINGQSQDIQSSDGGYYKVIITEGNGWNIQEHDHEDWVHTTSASASGTAGCEDLPVLFGNRYSPPPDGGPELQVHFIDVGQGDSILIDLGSHEALIDGGGKSPGVTDYISKYIDGPLEVMVATHPHADHIGGLIKVLEVFQVEEIWLNGDTSTSKTYQDFMAAVNAEEAEVNQAKRNGTISTEDLNFSILNPPDTLFSETNNNSIVLRLEYGDIAFLFTGDAEKEAEANMLTTGSELWAQILKAGHHCSRTSSSRPFLEKVKPEKAICMVGENNRYGHPHQETLTALKEIGAEIYRTDTDGTIIVLTDGISYEIETSK